MHLFFYIQLWYFALYKYVSACFPSLNLSAVPSNFQGVIFILNCPFLEFYLHSIVLLSLPLTNDLNWGKEAIASSWGVLTNSLVQSSSLCECIHMCMNGWKYCALTGHLINGKNHWAWALLMLPSELFIEKDACSHTCIKEQAKLPSFSKVLKFPPVFFLL